MTVWVRKYGVRAIAEAHMKYRYLPGRQTERVELLFAWMRERFGSDGIDLLLDIYLTEPRL